LRFSTLKMRFAQSSRISNGLQPRRVDCHRDRSGSDVDYIPVCLLLERAYRIRRRDRRTALIPCWAARLQENDFHRQTAFFPRRIYVRIARQSSIDCRRSCGIPAVKSMSDTSPSPFRVTMFPDIESI
jgi:hypothetical protein